MSIEPSRSAAKDELSDRDDGLDHFRADLAADPAAKNAYLDAHRRSSLLEALPLARRRMGLSQQDVASRMGTTQSAISDLESGKIEPQLRTLQRYARAVGHKLDVALVDAELPTFSAGLANGLWELVERQALPPLVTALISPADNVVRTAPGLADYCKLPEPIIMQSILTSFVQRGWLTAKRQGREDVYSLDPAVGYLIGITIHRTDIVGVLTTITNKITAERRRKLTSTSYQDVLQATAELAIELYREHDADKDVLGVSVALAGVVDHDRRIVEFAPDLATHEDRWTGVPFETDLQDAIRRAVDDRELLVRVENDANALALYEFLQSGDECVIVVLLSQSGQGIGAGIVVKGHLITGEHFAVGEGGHIIVDRNGPPCRIDTSQPPHSGCLESMVSAAAILERLDIRTNHPDGISYGLYRANELVHEGDEAAIEAFTSAGTALGTFVANLMILLDPTRLVIYGQPELVGDEAESAAIMRAAIAESLIGGVAKPGSLVDRIEWKSLDGTTEAQASTAAAMQDFLTKPDVWPPGMIVSRALAGGQPDHSAEWRSA